MNEPNGLPFIQLGNRKIIHIPTAREWLLIAACGGLVALARSRRQLVA
jgi:hypothetical protein